MGWCQRQIAADVRTLKSDLEMRFGTAIKTNMSVWPGWLVTRDAGEIATVRRAPAVLGSR